MNMKIYETSDFHLAITLSTLGFPLFGINKTDPKRFRFEFDETPELIKYLELYLRGELRLDPRLVLLSAKLMKDRMYEK